MPTDKDVTIRTEKDVTIHKKEKKIDTIYIQSYVIKRKKNTAH